MDATTNKPCVSVLMPSLNVGKYIRQSLESVINQTLEDIEVICIDAGSTDGTLEIIQELASQYPNVSVLASPVKSYGAQMNLGLAAAQGEYIGIVETDDYIDSDAFEKLYRLAADNGCDIAKANRYSLCEASDEYVEVLRGLPYNRVFKPVPDLPNIFNPAPCIWTAIYKRDFLIDNRIDYMESPGASFQDTGFVYKTYLAAEKMILTHDAFLHYRIDNENSSVKSSQKVFCVMDEFASIDRFLAERPEVRTQIWDKYCELRFRTYQWNATRLEKPEYDQFMRAFAEELLSFDAPLQFSDKCLSEQQRQLYRELLPPIEKAGSDQSLLGKIKTRLTARLFSNR